MTGQRVAGSVALGSGLLLALALVGSALAGPTAFANMGSDASSTIGHGMMGAAQMGHGMMGAAQMGHGMMGADQMGHGMMGMGHGMMGADPSGPAATAIPGAPEVRVQAANFSFSPNEIRLPKGAEVNLTFTNAAGTGVVHDLIVPGLGIHVAADPGKTMTVGLRGLAPGRYDAYCSVPGHAELGMRATVVVE